jgi:hypothetical protein
LCLPGEGWRFWFLVLLHSGYFCFPWLDAVTSHHRHGAFGPRPCSSHSTFLGWGYRQQQCSYLFYHVDHGGLSVDGLHMWWDGESRGWVAVVAAATPDDHSGGPHPWCHTFGRVPTLVDIVRDYSDSTVRWRMILVWWMVMLPFVDELTVRLWRGLRGRHFWRPSAAAVEIPSSFSQPYGW